MLIRTSHDVLVHVTYLFQCYLNKTNQTKKTSNSITYLDAADDFVHDAHALIGFARGLHP